MKNIVKPTLILSTVALIAAFLLAFVYNLTQPQILKYEKEKELKALAMVLPGYTIKETKTYKLKGADVKYWYAEKNVDGIAASGYAFIVSSSGYSGEVRSMIGIDQDFVLQGISILKQSETPGLGARAIEVMSSLTFFDFLKGKREDNNVKIPWFQEQFFGLNLLKEITVVKKGDWKPSMKEELLQKNEISAITGATITSRAVIKGIQDGMITIKPIIENDIAEKKKLLNAENISPEINNQQNTVQ